jgi:Fe-S-cluster containining protein
MRADPCDGCAADCCRGLAIVIHGWDAWRIARDLRLPMESFVAVEPADAPDPNYQLVLDAQASRRAYHRLALKRESGCVFLVSAGGLGRCGIYASRPSACRAYPALADGDLLQLTRREFCPPGAWDHIDEPVYRARYAFGQRQRLIHDAVTDGWNERVLLKRETRSAPELLRFIGDVYTVLARHADWFSDGPPLDEEAVRDQVARALGEIGWL